jgi:hypothetical protein
MQTQLPLADPGEIALNRPVHVLWGAQHGYTGYKSFDAA